MSVAMREDAISIHVGGAAGDGIDSFGSIIAKMSTRSGLHVYGVRWYQSIIRGGISGWRARVSNKIVVSAGDYIDILIPLTTDAANNYASWVRPGGLIIADERVKIPSVHSDIVIHKAPLVKMAREVVPKTKLLKNTVALGMLIYMLNYEMSIVEKMLNDLFGRKGQTVVQDNLKAVTMGIDWASEHNFSYEHRLQFNGKQRLFLTGNDAFALGAVAAGCTGWCQYPMTPATGTLHFMASVAAQKGLVVKQVEDEIGVINMALGMSFAGAKAGCATSGGGFALMTEAIGFAGIAELPIVVVNSMRGGPSTGLPTKTEQGDLNQMLGASQGDFPRVILASYDVKDTFDTAVLAFNLAEKYQIPVIVALDLLLSEHFETIDNLDLEVPIYHREKAVVEENIAYARYKYTESGISPRSIPSEKGLAYIAGSDEHDQYGVLLSDRHSGTEYGITERIKMVEKRMKKMDGVLSEFDSNYFHEEEGADVLLIGWGSTKGVISEAREILAMDYNIKTSHLQIKYVLPFKKEEVSEILKKYDKSLMIEENYSGQMERHIRGETGLDISNHLRNWSGEYLMPSEIVEKVMEVMNR